jgi:deoxycytidylate deaminase|uniref:CMP/dCMP-type deaminase domain-containing protein n=1 Tax=viral metagenome TaxID=1070528 RepID=A0A6C0BRD1_9ZZZZ
MARNRSNYDLKDVDISKTCDINQAKFLKKCAYLASKSILTQKHGCVIVYKNEIISCGYNFKINNNVQYKTDLSSYVTPIHFQDECSTEHYACGFSVHAEISTIKKVKNKDLSKCDMYVVRIGPFSNFKYSHPCKICADYIKQKKIKKVYYSVNSII